MKTISSGKSTPQYIHVPQLPKSLIWNVWKVWKGKSLYMNVTIYMYLNLQFNILNSCPFGKLWNKSVSVLSRFPSLGMHTLLQECTITDVVSEMKSPTVNTQYADMTKLI